MIRPLLLALVVSIALPGLALAQDRDNARYDPDRASPWTFELGGATDNRSKGASKSGGDPYVFGEVQYNAASGFYADAEFETIDSAGSRVETEVEAGWQFSGGGFDFDTSVSHKWRLNADPGQDDAAVEFQFDIMRDVGAADLRLGSSIRPTAWARPRPGPGSRRACGGRWWTGWRAPSPWGGASRTMRWTIRAGARAWPMR